MSLLPLRRTNTSPRHRPSRALQAATTASRSRIQRRPLGKAAAKSARGFEERLSHPRSAEPSRFADATNRKSRPAAQNQGLAPSDQDSFLYMKGSPPPGHE